MKCVEYELKEKMVTIFKQNKYKKMHVLKNFF